DAPPAVVLALAADQLEIAAYVLERSPLFIDADLVDTVAGGESVLQIAIARRLALPRAVAAAIAEVGTPEACPIPIETHSADIAPFSLDGMVAGHAHLGAIRKALLERDDLPMPSRQAVLVRLSQTLADFVSARAWLDEGRAQRVAKEACEKATVALAA